MPFSSRPGVWLAASMHACRASLADGRLGDVIERSGRPWQCLAFGKQAVHDGDSCGFASFPKKKKKKKTRVQHWRPAARLLREITEQSHAALLACGCVASNMLNWMRGVWKIGARMQCGGAKIERKRGSRLVLSRPCRHLCTKDRESKRAEARPSQPVPNLASISPTVAVARRIQFAADGRIGSRRRRVEIENTYGILGSRLAWVCCRRQASGVRRSDSFGA